MRKLLIILFILILLGCKGKGNSNTINLTDDDNTFVASNQSDIKKMQDIQKISIIEDGFIFVEGSMFIMGDGSEENNPPHEVVVSDFYISAYELTVKDWKIYIEDALIDFDWIYAAQRGHLPHRRIDGKNIYYEWPDDSPIFHVTWLEAIKYCNWLSEKRNLIPVYRIKMNGEELEEVDWDRNANGYRLPTEAEWEYAALGGIKSNNYIYAGSNDIDEVAWFGDNSNGTPHTVGSKKPNELGIYDMTGNVREWCWDFYANDYYFISPKFDPSGPVVGNVFNQFENERQAINARVVRGQSWSSRLDWLPLRSRSGFQYYGTASHGVRLARNAL